VPDQFLGRVREDFDLFARSGLPRDLEEYLRGDDFQLAMLAAVHEPEHPDYLIYAKWLFDPDREFEGRRGIVYGGPDLSDRNLRLLSALWAGQAARTIPRPALEISATGDIGYGRMASSTPCAVARAFRCTRSFSSL
jgi:hypothetical protein